MPKQKPKPQHRINFCEMCGAIMDSLKQGTICSTKCGEKWFEKYICNGLKPQNQ